MKKATILTLICAATATAAAQTEKGANKMPNPNAEQQVRETIQEMNGALVSRDTEALERIFADGYIFTTPIGTTLDKAQRLRSVATGERTISSLDFPELKVQLYGDTAVATSRYEEHVGAQNTKQEGRSTNVFVRLDGRWQMGAGQSQSANVTQK